ncbi:MAG: RyR domain-containing protein [Acidimicrobiales bacterium]|nr:RyR domain-containing protein [Acidimicrobiales bacterium]
MVRGALRRLAGHAGVIIALAALAAFVLGAVGFRAYVPGRRLTEYFYRSLQLFIIYVDPTGAPDPSQVPVALDVARFLAPAAGAAAGIRAVLGLFGQRATRAWVRYFVRDHVVVCGMGALGTRLAAAFSAAGHRVVGVDVAGGTTAGVLRVAGDATDPHLLRKAGVAGARYLVVASEDDAWNAEVALAARDVVAHRRRGLPCFVHVEEPGLSGLLAEAALGAGGTGQLRLEFFNVWESVPPTVLDEFPPGDHLLVAGAGPLGQALVMHAARRQAGAGRRLQATLVGHGADAAGRELAERYPRLAAVCDLHTFDMAVDSAAFTPPPATSAYVTGDLRDALSIARALPTVRTVVLTSERSGLATLVAAIAPESSSIVHFDVLERSCRPEIVLDGTIEVLARAIHAAYVRDHAGRTDTPAMRDWEELPESTKEANRAQAAHVGTKLAAVGCRLQAWTDWTGDGPAFTPAEIEIMAELEHERWCRERTTEGWTAGPTRDDDRKVTPSLVDWDQLPDDVKDYNRNAVRALPELLTFAGYEIVRVR